MCNSDQAAAAGVHNSFTPGHLLPMHPNQVDNG